MLTTRFFFVQPCVHAVLGEAGVESPHGVTVRVPQGDDMAEEDFERAFGRPTDWRSLVEAFGHVTTTS